MNASTFATAGNRSVGGNNQKAKLLEIAACDTGEGRGYKCHDSRGKYGTDRPDGEARPKKSQAASKIITTHRAHGKEERGGGCT